MYFFTRKGTIIENAKENGGKKMKQITIMEHPLIQHKISILRNEATGTNEFRRLIEEIAMLMGYEALRDQIGRAHV